MVGETNIESKAPAANEFDPNMPRIVVAGVGGAGCNTINRLAKSGVAGAKMMAFNTDKKHLSLVNEKAVRVLIGARVTKGMGAGGFPEVAEKAARTSYDDITKLLEGVDLLFLTAGMGGGTGTGASPVIAEIAKKNGALVVGIVTYPFSLERARLKKAEKGIEALRAACDTVVIIDNNRLVEYVPNLPMEQAFALEDEITARAVRGITETIQTPSLINIDFADMKSVMQNGGVSMIAVGEGKGIDRVEEVAKNTLEQKLLDVDYTGARGVLLHITGGPEMTLGDANEIGSLITKDVSGNTNVIWGARLDPNFAGKVEVIAIFTGMNSPYTLGKKQ